MDIYTLPNVKYLASGKQPHRREIRSVLWNHLEGWEREGVRETQEGADMGIYVYIYLIHFVIQQQLTQHCKASILQYRR